MSRFGRLVEFDERSRKFPIRTCVPDKPRRSYTWSCDIVLDQGNEGACTGFSVCHEAAARPVKVKGINNNVAREVYHMAQQLDEWPGDDYEGSSVLGAMKAGRQKGWYKEYRWAFGEQDLCLAVGYKGPCVLGINWYDGMSTPDSKGIIAPTGAIAGGHAIMCNGFNVKTGLYRLHNSWGNWWGINGECFIHQDHMARLLAEQGEACIPVIRTGA
jgi:hypothetical protein